MTKRIALAVALALPAMLLLAACDPTPLPTPDPTPTSTEVEPVETPAPLDPAPILPADYLVEHTPASDESHELFHYAFWTDDSRSVRCDVWIGGQSDPYTDCLVMSAAEGSVSYTLPAGYTADCSAKADPPLDGFEVAVIAIPADAGYDSPRAWLSGCAAERPYPSVAVAAATLVLPEGGVLDLDPFRCSATTAVATCEYLALGASVSLGLTAIAVVN